MQNGTLENNKCITNGHICVSVILFLSTYTNEMKICLYKNLNSGRARWLKPVMPALWEAEAGESRGQENKTIPVNMVKPHLY